MKSKQYRLLELKRQIQKPQNRGKEWSFTQEQKDYIEKSLRAKVKPYRYLIYTKQFSNIRYIKSELIKDIHYANVRKKPTISRILNHEQRHTLDYFNVSYKPIKYKVCD